MINHLKLETVRFELRPYKKLDDALPLSYYTHDDKNMHSLIYNS